MKIKEMKEKTVEFIKENKAAIAVGGSVFVYGVGMCLYGIKTGRKLGEKEAIQRFAQDIRIGMFTRELEMYPGKYTLDRFFNEDHLNGKINSFNTAVKLLGDPENTKDIVGMVICRKEND